MKKIISKGDVKVLTTKHTKEKTSTTIQYDDVKLKLVTNHKNGNGNSTIYMFSPEHGWVFLYEHDEIVGVEGVSYVMSSGKIEEASINNFWAMVEHIKKVFI